MTQRAIAIAILTTPLVVSSPGYAQTVDQLLADPSALRAELERCKTLGMAATTDARCQVADQAEQKRFFGTGKSQYTPTPVHVFPGQPEPVIKPAQPGGKAPNE
jgi:conjugative transfer region protein TrbK